MQDIFHQVSSVVCFPGLPEVNIPLIHNLLRSYCWPCLLDLAQPDGWRKADYFYIFINRHRVSEITFAVKAVLLIELAKTPRLELTIWFVPSIIGNAVAVRHAPFCEFVVFLRL